MNSTRVFAIVLLILLGSSLPSISWAQGGKIVHDAEYYILEAQNGKRWTLEDEMLDAKLAELRAKYGTPPNIIHVMWDDTSFGDVGIPAISKIRGFETPSLNRIAEEGILFTRMYTEVGCTPSRAAVLTGRLAVRSGMYVIGFPIEYSGMRGEEVTIAEVLSGAGYATAMYGKLHLGDIEQSYAHNQGFDETLFGVYNQVFSLFNEVGEGANAIMGLKEEMLVPDPYKLDSRFVQHGYVGYIEGKKGEPGREWRGTAKEDYDAFDPETKVRALDFIRRNAAADKPFYVAWWPMMTSFIPNPKKQTVNRGLYTDAMQYNVDAFIGELMDELEELGVAENTLLIAMADNGPMAHNPPPGLGMTETIFRGGKGDFLEGGVRVPAFAWWPGVIEPGQIVGDMIHEVDLFTTFARLGGALDQVPTDRVIDGQDQTALFLKGDTHGRRDYVFIYQGPNLGATVKGNVKKHWISPDPTAASGIGAAYYDLLSDTREKSPMLVNMLPANEAFNRMRARHELWKQRYPHSSRAHGPAFTGVSNARPETKALSEPPIDMKDLPFDLFEFIEYELPWEYQVDPDVGQ
ncbi:MAG: sulfatase-like hydrolase/transferase [Thermoanaerobaculia bacterium]